MCEGPSLEGKSTHVSVLKNIYKAPQEKISSDIFKLLPRVVECHARGCFIVIAPIACTSCDICTFVYWSNPPFSDSRAIL